MAALLTRPLWRQGRGLLGLHIRSPIALLSPSDCSYAKACVFRGLAVVGAAARWLTRACRRAADNVGLGDPLQARYHRFFAARVDDYMGPEDMTSTRCLPRQDCKPLGGQSVWGSLAPQSPTAGKVLVAAALDDTSLFHEHVPAVSTAVASLSVALAATQAAADALTAADAPAAAALTFGFFQGEVWDRVGSRKWMHDVKTFTCSVRRLVPPTALVALFRCHLSALRPSLTPP